MTVKHTPGPWRYEEGSAEDFIVMEPTGRTICEPNAPLYENDEWIRDSGLRHISTEEAQANGHLIAAAPETYQQLISSTALLVRLSQEAALYGFNDDERGALIQQIEINRQAIKKAEGQ